MVIGAVILGNSVRSWHDDLTDSKKLSAKKRSELNEYILQEALAAGLGWVPASEIDKYGLSNALRLATNRAVKQVLQKQIPFDEIIIDGTVNFLCNTPLEDKVTTMKKADFLIKEVSAASIIAKVARDNYMIELASKYPEYGFEKHVGYGTAAHMQALVKYGACPEHRHSFRPVREIVNSGDHIIGESKDEDHTKNVVNFTTDFDKICVQSTVKNGKIGEKVIINYLESIGHAIMAHNFKTKTYEIDIISTYDDKIYFTEVKYRKNSNHGSVLEQITQAKREQIEYAAKAFLSQHPEFQQHQPLLAAGAVSGKNFTFEDWFVIC